MRAGLRVAVVGATGIVGRTMVKVLAQRRFPLQRLRLFATARSAGSTLAFGDAQVTVEETGDSVLEHDLVLFAGGDDASRRYAWAVAERGGVAVDNSSTWRLDPRVPLVVPEVNGEALRTHAGVIANPNCCAVALVMALKPLAAAAGLSRVHVATYQAVSGGGIENARALLAQTRSLLAVPEALEDGDLARIHDATGDDAPVAFNVRPQWRWQPDGDTEEEAKIVAETRKMLAADVPVTVTTLRVPVLVGHTLVVHLTLARPMAPEEARSVLAAFPGIEVVDDAPAGRFPTPLLAAGRDAVYVGLIRPDRVDPRGLRLVICVDNLRKGSATNAVQIAEALVASGSLRPRAGVVTR
ncbi:MAG: aspartate-semialdehyde dehydrogenase [Armatimonadota bacterium]|nr:aspartate-semialdehyde dehydrogenase [Armatimonadota bacterium]MDR7532352.1 aspartate-semialdehyde dehydrogenase [Armatimonadota bacterium]MDR7535279.1 aspartate-semialdehyde dehydrogenase [Armatimonadota bacterium]